MSIGRTIDLICIIKSMVSTDIATNKISKSNTYFYINFITYFEHFFKFFKNIHS